MSFSSRAWVSFVRSIDGQEFLLDSGLADGRGNGHAQGGVVALPGQGGHPVALELGETRGGQDEVVDEIGVLEFARREVVELHALEGPADDIHPGRGLGLSGPDEAFLIGQTRDRMQQGGDDPRVPVSGGFGQDDVFGPPRRLPASFAPARDVQSGGGRGQVLVGLGVEGARVGEEDDGRGDRLGQLVEPGIELSHLGQALGGEAADQELEAAGVGRQAELALGGQADDVAGILLGPAVENGDVLAGRPRPRGCLART